MLQVLLDIASSISQELFDSITIGKTTPRKLGLTIQLPPFVILPKTDMRQLPAAGSAKIPEASIPVSIVLGIFQVS
jgi:hypothetical protein